MKKKKLFCNSNEFLISNSSMRLRDFFVISLHRIFFFLILIFIHDKTNYKTSKIFDSFYRYPGDHTDNLKII